MTERPVDLSSLPSYGARRRSLFSARKFALMASVVAGLGAAVYGFSPQGPVDVFTSAAHAQVNNEDRNVKQPNGVADITEIRSATPAAPSSSIWWPSMKVRMASAISSSETSIQWSTRSRQKGKVIVSASKPPAVPSDKVSSEGRSRTVPASTDRAMTQDAAGEQPMIRVFGETSFI